jgi:hypothetical protein
VTANLAWTALVLLLVVVGRLGWHCSGRKAARASPGVAPPGWAARVEQSWLALASGFGLLSSGLFVLAHLGRFTTPVIVATVALFVAGCAAACLRRRHLRETLAALPLDLALGATLAVSSVLFGMVLPPLDTTLAASDSSVYLGIAHHLARQGTLRHHDALVAEMTVEEREALFRNRFDGDHTGPYARFPGGVALVAPSGDEVGFYFYHLFPIWLAVGLKVVGSELYLRLMGLFACMSLGSLFLVGRRLGGTALALAVGAVHVSFYPQVFYSRFPTSELLAQALFLSGLAALLIGLDPENGATQPYPHLAGVLWGVFCLCRVDALPFLVLGLTLMSVLPASTGVRARDWAIPMFVTVLFGLQAVYHQLSNGIRYAGAFPRGRLAEVVGTVAGRGQWPSLVVLAALAAAGVLAFRCDPASQRGARLRIVTRGVALAVSTGILARFLVRWDGSLVARHVGWIAMYATVAILLMLSAGVVAALVACLLGRAARGSAVAAAFFVGPAFCYLVDPMVLPLQPWAMRRFVPIVCPLLFLLALSGWRAGLRRLSGGRTRLAGAVLAGVAMVTVFTFLRSSAGSARGGGSTGTEAQLSALARAIPRDALIVIPDSNADLHEQVALQYGGGRDVLLLPLADGPEARVEKTMTRFLARRIDEGRRVCLLLARPGDLAGPLARHFQIDFLFERTLSFASVEFVAHDAFPSPPATALLRNLVLELRPPGTTRMPDAISLGDARQDVGFLVQGFHAPEVEAHAGQPPQPFRWTGPVATMAFPPGAAIELTLDTSRPPQAEPPRIEVDVDGVPAPAISTVSEGVHRVRVPFPPTAGSPAKRIVRLRTNAFRMRDLGLSADARELGVKVISVEIEPRSEAVAPTRP